MNGLPVPVGTPAQLQAWVYPEDGEPRRLLGIRRFLLEDDGATPALHFPPGPYTGPLVLRLGLQLPGFDRRWIWTRLDHGSVWIHAGFTLDVTSTTVCLYGDR